MDKEFFRKVIKLIKIAIPSWKSPEVGHLVLMTVMLCARTYLSIKLAAINGNIVKTIVDRDFASFVHRCIFLELRQQFEV